MPDTQIHPLGTVPAPGDFTIPGSAELRLKGVYASFDGSGAATSFVPLVRFISDAGSVALEAPADTTIAAGGSADASWFPRVAAAARAAGGSAAAYATAELNVGLGDPQFAVPAGGSTTLGFPNVAVSDPSILAWSTTTNANDTLTLTGTGVALAVAKTQWESANFGRAGVMNFNYGQFLGGTDTPASKFDPAANGAPQTAYTLDVGFVPVDPSGPIAQVVVENLDGANIRHVTRAWFNVLYWQT